MFVVWDSANGDHGDFLQHLNNQHSDIVLTEELEMDGSLAFLDVKIKRPVFKEDGSLSEPLQIDIHRKPTHGNRYLHFNSCHPLFSKRNVVKGLVLRAHRILKNFPEQLQTELQFPKQSFLNPNNGYPVTTLNMWLWQIERDLLLNPEKLDTKSRLDVGDVFEDAYGNQQKFAQPTALARFPQEDAGPFSPQSSVPVATGLSPTQLAERLVDTALGPSPVSFALSQSNGVHGAQNSITHVLNPTQTQGWLGPPKGLSLQG